MSNGDSNTVTLDIDAFRSQYPAFSDSTVYPDSMLGIWWIPATCQFSPVANCYVSYDCVEQVLYAILAHYLYISTSAANGVQTGYITSGTVDKISVSMQSIPVRNISDAYWIQSPYGQTYQALVAAISAGGMYFAGKTVVGNIGDQNGQITSSNQPFC